MKLISLALLLLVAAAPVFATTITLTGNTCNDPSCVIGAISEFGIQGGNVVVNTTTDTAVANLFFNFGPDTTLTPFTQFGVTLNPGDLLFSVAGAYTYAIPLIGHNGMTAGDLYQISGVLNAQTVLGNPSGVIYRNTDDVWASGGTLVPGSNGSMIVGGGGGSPFDVTLSFTPGVTFLNAFKSGNVTFQFSSATCGNGIITGSAVPEPGTLALMGSALIGLAFLRRRTAAGSR